jgi:hypothetical protein
MDLYCCSYVAPDTHQVRRYHYHRHSITITITFTHLLSTDVLPIRHSGRALALVVCLLGFRVSLLRRGGLKHRRYSCPSGLCYLICNYHLGFLAPFICCLQTCNRSRPLARPVGKYRLGTCPCVSEHARTKDGAGTGLVLVLQPLPYLYCKRWSSYFSLFPSFFFLSHTSYTHARALN